MLSGLTFTEYAIRMCTDPILIASTSIGSCILAITADVYPAWVASNASVLDVLRKNSVIL
ncbi:hypothetical protein [Halodesulfovibrio sp. MK-HDV]|uniref:hypothetical protein n=1 Tax=Halodesulfovibrio sp. MK-HDV TaxID=2599925 RepID=UPI00136DB0B6|nr:hypothetical protein [Halodesulfovibrio sp. MK-HDV]